MKGKSILGKEYKPTNKYFPKYLTRAKNEIFIPSETKNPFMECIHKALYGDYHLMIEEEEMEADFDKYSPLFDTGKANIIQVAEKYKVRIDIWAIRSQHGGKGIVFIGGQTPTNQQYHIALLSDGMNGWGWMIPEKSGKLKFISRKQCETCSVWMQSNVFQKHIQDCMKCDCGQRHKQGDDHETVCTKRDWKEKEPSSNTIRVYKASKARKENLSSCHFADFETFPEAGSYVVYSASLLSSGKPRNLIGNDCMQRFVLNLLNLRGTLWFFNGGKFDCYFLLTECIRMNVNIVPKSILKSGRTIMTFSIKTEKGQLDIKDLYRFLPGSLLANCKAFQIDKKLYKTGFDHGAVKCWEDVETHKAKIIKYNDQDVLALRAVYEAYAKDVFEEHKLHVCKFMTASHLFLAAWTLTLIKANLIIKTPKEDEALMRAFYRGGRIFLSQAQWRSVMFQMVESQAIPVTRLVAKYKDGGDYVTIGKDYWNMSEQEREKAEIVCL